MFSLPNKYNVLDYKSYLFSSSKTFLVLMFFSFVRFIRHMTSGKRTVLVVPPTSSGSLGDQAMLQGVIDGLSKSSGTQVRQVLLPGWLPQKVCGGVTQSIKIRSLYTRGAVFLLPKLISCKYIGIIGADVIDEKYSIEKVRAFVDLCNIVSWAGVPSKIFGFSFSADPGNTIISLCRNLDRRVDIMLRDPVSKKRFEEFTGLNAKRVADLAFLMQPRFCAPHAKEARDWCWKRRGMNRKILGVNANVHTAPGEISRLIAKYIQVLSNLADSRDDLDFLFLPHDFRTGQSDVDTLNEIVRGLGRQLQDRVHFLKPPYSAWDIKAVVGELDLILTGRMHLAIAALGQCIPVVCLTYQDKFEGLAMQFDLGELILNPKHVMEEPEVLVAALEGALENAQDIKSRISTALSKVQDLALENLR